MTNANVTYRRACGGMTWGAYIRARIAEETRDDIPNRNALETLAFLRVDVLPMVRSFRFSRQLNRSTRKHRARTRRVAAFHAVRA